MMPQMPSREKLLAWIDQVSFAVVEMNLYLDTHPEDEDALAFFLIASPMVGGPAFGANHDVVPRAERHPAHGALDPSIIQHK